MFPLVPIRCFGSVVGGTVNKEPLGPGGAPASPGPCQAPARYTAATAAIAQSRIHSHPSLSRCCNYFRQNRTLETRAAHFKGQEVRQSARMPSDTVGVAGAIHLALLSMHPPWNPSAPLSSPLVAPPCPLSFAADLSPPASCSFCLCSSPELDLCFLSFIHSTVCQQLFGTQQ